jgi:hypothetical protein
MTPGIPGFRESVAEQDQRPLSLFGDVHLDAVGRNDAALYFSHVTTLPRFGHFHFHLYASRDIRRSKH